MKSPTHKAQCAEDIFQCSTLFLLQMIYQGQAEHDTTFENFLLLTSRTNTSTTLLTGQGFIFKFTSLHDW